MCRRLSSAALPQAHQLFRYGAVARTVHLHSLSNRSFRHKLDGGSFIFPVHLKEKFSDVTLEAMLRQLESNKTAKQGSWTWCLSWVFRKKRKEKGGRLMMVVLGKVKENKYKINGLLELVLPIGRKVNKVHLFHLSSPASCGFSLMSLCVCLCWNKSNKKLI